MTRRKRGKQARVNRLAIGIAAATIGAIILIHYLVFFLVTGLIVAGSTWGIRIARKRIIPRSAPLNSHYRAAKALQLTAREVQLIQELETARLRITELETQLGQARKSAALAWDAAAERKPAEPRAIPPAPLRDRLLDDNRSGAKPLGNSE